MKANTRTTHLGAFGLILALAMFVIGCASRPVPLPEPEPSIADTLGTEPSPPPIETMRQEQLFLEATIVVKGEGVAPTDRPLTDAQKALLAKRAATIVAQRALAEVLNDVRVIGETTVSDMAVRSDGVRSTVDALVTGGEIIYESYDASAELGTVFLRVRNEGPDGVLARLSRATMNDPEIIPAVPRYAGPIQQGTGAQNFDALILDVSGTGFVPATRNRILAYDGRLLFGAEVIAPQVLAQKPMADYTNDIAKARAILAREGAMNPLVVRVDRIPKVTDAQVNEKITRVIDAANKRFPFLEGARVVFVL